MTNQLIYEKLWTISKPSKTIKVNEYMLKHRSHFLIKILISISADDRKS